MTRERTILHIDLNNFYASVACLYHPELRNVPMAVGGNAKQRHGIVLAKNSAAKALGIKTGEPLWQAKQKCPNLVFISPEFSLYLKFSNLVRSLYEEYTSQVESFGLDECWLDVTHSPASLGSGKEIADDIRKRVKQEFGVTVSVGVSFNKIFAKLGSDLKKPDATTVITKDNYRALVWPLPVEYLLFAGRSTTKKLKADGIYTIGALANSDPVYLEQKFGKPGVTLWEFANGLEESGVCLKDADRDIKSIGNSTTLPRDLHGSEEAKIPLYILCESVAERLRKHELKCQGIQLHLKNTQLEVFERQAPLACATYSANALFDTAYHLLLTCVPPQKMLRSIGVRAIKLLPQDGVQLSFLPELVKIQKQEAGEAVIDEIRKRYGHFSVQRGIMLEDINLSNFDPQREHIIHPEAFVPREVKEW